MPVNIDVYINNSPIKQYRIGRAEGDTDPDSKNTYRILEFAAGDTETQKWADGVEFQHRYGDGVDVCISKGLAALIAAKADEHWVSRG
jgi:hypothetical protein